MATELWLSFLCAVGEVGPARTRPACYAAKTCLNSSVIELADDVEGAKMDGYIVAPVSPSMETYDLGPPIGRTHCRGPAQPALDLLPYLLAVRKPQRSPERPPKDPRGRPKDRPGAASMHLQDDGFDSDVEIIDSTSPNSQQHYAPNSQQHYVDPLPSNR